MGLKLLLLAMVSFIFIIPKIYYSDNIVQKIVTDFETLEN